MQTHAKYHLMLENMLDLLDMLITFCQEVGQDVIVKTFHVSHYYFCCIYMYVLFVTLLNSKKTF